MWQLAGYPALWLALVAVAVFGLGLGTAVSEGEAVIGLARAYVGAREKGEARLACSMLTDAQQRELVAIQTGSYATATPAGCPSIILGNDPRSHLLNPQLALLTSSSVATEYSPLGVVVVYSREDPAVALVAVREDGTLKLDIRGLQRVEFIRGCTAAGFLNAATCGCTFDRARASGQLPRQPGEAGDLTAIRADAIACGGTPPTSSGLHT
jgi:hypothetical protein